MFPSIEAFLYNISIKVKYHLMKFFSFLKLYPLDVLKLDYRFNSHCKNLQKVLSFDMAKKINNDI